jgi:hypothetical protein
VSKDKEVSCPSSCRDAYVRSSAYEDSLPLGALLSSSRRTGGRIRPRYASELEDRAGGQESLLCTYLESVEATT